jgi:hypothetical protein
MTRDTIGYINVLASGDAGFKIEAWLFLKREEENASPGKNDE